MAGPDGPIAELPSYQPEPEPEPLEAEVAALDDDIGVAPIEEPAPAPIRRPPPPSRRAGRSEGRSSVLVWAGVAGLAAALIAGAIVFREQMVRVWPRSAAAYAGLGLEVAGGGLVLEQVKVQPAFLAGRPILSVTGAIRNMRDVPVNAPPVRLTLLNRAGQPVAAKIARPDDAAIPARARRRFVVTLIDPPSTARDLDVRFDGFAAKTVPARAAEAVLTPAPGLPQPASRPAEVAPAAPEQLSPAVATEHG